MPSSSLTAPPPRPAGQRPSSPRPEGQRQGRVDALQHRVPLAAGGPPLPPAHSHLTSSAAASAAAALQGPVIVDVVGIPVVGVRRNSGSNLGKHAQAAERRTVQPARTRCQRLSLTVLLLVYGAVLALIAIMSWQLATTDAANKPYITWCIAAFFVGLTVPLSLHDINMHLLYFVNPMQRFYVRIIFLVPIYSVESWFSLRYAGASIYVSTLKDLYEPFVIHALLSLMLEFLGNRDALVQKLLAKHGKFANISMFPYGIEALRKYSCRPPNEGGWFPCIFWPNGSTFIYRTQVGVYQYIVIKVILTVGFFIASLTGTLDYGGNNPSDYYVYYSWVLLVSQVWAICCLVLFFEATLSLIWPMKPFMKFVAVKGLVFVSWAQQELIGYLQSEGYVQAYQNYSVQDIANGLQSFIICVEMLGLAVMHHYAFSVSDFYVPGKGALGNEQGVSEPQLLHPRMTALEIALSVLPAHDLASEATYHATKGVEKANRVGRNLRRKTKAVPLVATSTVSNAALGRGKDQAPDAAAAPGGSSEEAGGAFESGRGEDKDWEGDCDESEGEEVEGHSEHPPPDPQPSRFAARSLTRPDRDTDSPSSLGPIPARHRSPE